MRNKFEVGQTIIVDPQQCPGITVTGKIKSVELQVNDFGVTEPHYLLVTSNKDGGVWYPESLVIC